MEISTGSLGQGFSVACGMAMASKLDNAPWNVYTLLGDGEVQEGIVWEAAMSAAHYKLDNLIAFLDNNGLQIDGDIESVMSLGSIVDKFKAFGWNVIEIDGHDFDQIFAALDIAKSTVKKPTMIVAKTIKGKGISFMENQAGWHGTAPSDEELEKALLELGASTFAMFATGRAFEIIRNSVCYPKLNVKICATHAGLTVGEDGASHESVEDIAIMRAIPNMTVLVPADGVETEKIIFEIAKYNGPVYVRLGRSFI